MGFSLKEMKNIKKGEIPEMRSLCAKLKQRTRPLYDIKGSLNERINIITELKHSSPSAGSLSSGMDDNEIIKKYIRGGAAAVSVLAEKNFFDGSYEHLRSAAASCEKPVLCKDFIYFEEQVEAAYLSGADMVLLISRALERDEIRSLYCAIKHFGMTPLVEVHGEDEIDDVMFLDPELVLVNMRNLETLEIDTRTGINTLNALPSSLTRISASGINSKDDIMFIEGETGANSFLIGSSLMKSGDPEKMLREFKDVH